MVTMAISAAAVAEEGWSVPRTISVAMATRFPVLPAVSPQIRVRIAARHHTSAKAPDGQMWGRRSMARKQPAALPAMKAPIVTIRLLGGQPGSTRATQKPIKAAQDSAGSRNHWAASKGTQQPNAPLTPRSRLKPCGSNAARARTGLRSAFIGRSFAPCTCISAGSLSGEVGAGIAGEAEGCVARTIAYVANAESKDIFVFDMDRQSGALSLVERVPVPGTDLPSPTSLPMAVSPDRRFLYAALRSPPFAASSFGIDASSGRLSHLATTPLLCAMAYIVIDRSGQFLLAASYTDARLAIYPIDSAGRIEGRTMQVTPTGPNAHCVVVDAANRFAYSAVLGADHVMQLVFDPDTGTLGPNTPSTVTTRARSGPRHLAFHPTGRFIYLLNQTDATIVAYRIEPGSGGLSEIETVATLPAHFLGEANAADIHATPDGRFLYASERQTSTLTGFRIDSANGFLAPIGRWDTETTPRGFAIDPRGGFLLAAGLDSNRLSVHAIDPEDGSLSPQAQYPLGGMPNWVEIVDLP